MALALATGDETWRFATPVDVPACTPAVAGGAVLVYGRRPGLLRMWKALREVR